LSFGAILLNQSDGYLRASAAVQNVKSVNAASYEAGPLARGSLAAVFGNNLAAETVKSQDVNPPKKLGDVTVQLTGSDNVTRAAELVMVSPQQINFVIPDGSPLGKTQMVIKNGEKDAATGEFQVVDSSPALFTSDSGDGKSKLAVGMTNSNGSDPQGLQNPDGSPRLIGSGSLWAPNTITLLGTGLRYALDVQVLIGDQKVTPTFVGPDDTPGVDQVSFKIPTNVRGGMNKLSLVVNTRSSAAASSGATTLAAGATQSGDTTVTSNAVQAALQGAAPPGPFTLSAADVQLIIAQAVAKAQQIGFLATIAVVDKEANVLGIFKMTGARSDILVGSTDLTTGKPTRLFQNGQPDTDGLEQVRLPLAPGLGLLSDGAALAAISKAGTAAFFSTQGSSITTRTASDIIQENFPVGVTSQPGGPLFGVQFSSLPCSDVRQVTSTLPLGLAGDLGGLGIYKNGTAVGGVGIEGDGFYSIDTRIDDFDIQPEERIAVAAIKGFRPLPAFRADRILIDGMRVNHDNVPLNQADGPAAAPFGSLPGTVISTDPVTGAPFIRGQQLSRFTPLTLGGVPGRVILDPDPNPVATGIRQGFFPFKSSAVSNLTAADVTRILTQAAQQAYRMRAAIRLPVPLPVEVNITVVDASGVVLGIFSTFDAPEFGFDVSAQKARTSAFFSTATAGAFLRSAEGGKFAKFADAALAFGVKLDGSVAFSERANGFLSRPFFPDGINGAPNGPFSKDIRFWSPFNVGLQLALDRSALVTILTTGTIPPVCTAIPGLGTGIQIFAGGVPLYKNGVLVGGIGVSGDGIDQDDTIASAGSFGYEAPAAIRADQLTPFNVRLPYVKFPRHPNIGTPPANPPVVRTGRVFSNTN